MQKTPAVFFILYRTSGGAAIVNCRIPIEQVSGYAFATSHRKIKVLKHYYP